MKYCAFIGSITIDSDLSYISGDSGYDTLAEGEYYLAKPTAGAECLLTQICAMLSTLCAQTVIHSVNEYGVVTLSSATSFSWGLAGAVGTLLGFPAGSGAGASSYTGSTPMGRSFFPGVPAANTSVPEGYAGVPEADITTQRAPDRTRYRLVWSSERVLNKIEVEWVPLAKTWPNTPGTFRNFWATVLKFGRGFIFVPDGDTTLNWFDGSCIEYTDSDTDGASKPSAVQSSPGSHAYWNCTITAEGDAV